jgi:hypothetical protein
LDAQRCGHVVRILTIEHSISRCDEQHGAIRESLDRDILRRVDAAGGCGGEVERCRAQPLDHRSFLKTATRS